MDRHDLLETLATRVEDHRVLAAIADVDRALFVPLDQQASAWLNEPLPIGEGQTISQPLIVALMCQYLDLSPDDLVLDVGTGSGYHAAVLSRLGRKVISIERHRSLLAAAAKSLDAAGIDNVTLVYGDGADGYPAKAPYGAINVAAASRDRPSSVLIDQLVDGGSLVIPVGRWRQRLLICRRQGGRIIREQAEEVAFVPLISDRK